MSKGKEQAAWISDLTSYVTLTPVEAGWRKVTEETDPVPDKMHIALGRCCEKDNNFATMSWNKENLQFKQLLKRPTMNNVSSN